MNFSSRTHKPLRRRRPITVIAFARNRRCKASANSRLHQKPNDLKICHDISSISKSASNSTFASIRGGLSGMSRKMRVVAEVSVRKLIASLWQLRFVSDCLHFDRIDFKPIIKHLSTMFPHHFVRKDRGEDENDLLQTPIPSFISNAEHEIMLKFTMEGMTKWDPKCSMTSVPIDHMWYHMRLHEDRVQTISTLKAKLLKAQLSIQELEAERDSSEKKVCHRMSKFNEDQTSWKIKEKYKSGAIIDSLKRELNRERNKNVKLEFLNSKLIKLIAEAKFSETMLMQNFDEANKVEYIWGEICDELTKKFGEDVIEIESSKSKLIELYEEVEEEREMLHMAEVWREERVQLKLIDAKLALEDKYSQMNKLITELETFMSSNNITMDEMKLKKAEEIKEAAKSITIQDMKEFSYIPSKQGDFHSVVEEVKQMRAREKDVKRCDNHTPFNSPNVSPKTNDFDSDLAMKHSNYFSADNNSKEYLNWKTTSHSHDQDPSYSDEKSEPSINMMNKGKGVLLYEKEYEDNIIDGSSIREITKTCLISTGQLKHKSSTISRHDKASYCNNDGNIRLSDGTISTMDTLSLHRKSIDGSHQH